jgi:hypothetical protein
MERTKESTLRALLAQMRAIAPGHDYAIEVWRPGDGWTRYRIEEKGGSRNISLYMRKNELEQWMRAFILGAESAIGGWSDQQPYCGAEARSRYDLAATTEGRGD